MALNCAISGEVPEEPVVSPVSGAVFEKRLILKHLDDNDADPVTGETLTKDDLVEIKASKIVRPRPPTATSIPVLIKLFQDEWDATVLETYKLRQYVHTIRQELTHALYQHDAACRVIARLTRERDEARHALETMQPGPAPVASASAEAMDVDSSDGLTAALVDKLAAHSKGLSKARKRRGKDLKEGKIQLPPADPVKALAEKQSRSGMHTSSSVITSLSLGNLGDDLVLTGGSDKKAILFDMSENKVVATLKGHKKKVTDVIRHPSTDGVSITSSADNTVCIWNGETSSSVIETHQADVTGISLHPTGEYFVSASDDRHWGFHNIETGKTLTYSTDADVDSGLSCAQIHPDGMIFGTGSTNGIVQIWKLSEKSFTPFPGHKDTVTSIAFSENGYYLATGSNDCTVKLWDLRKLENFHTIELGAGNKVSSVSFDPSGAFLAVGGSDVRVYASKTWDQLCALDTHKKHVTDVAFGASSTALYSTSADRTVKFYSS